MLRHRQYYSLLDDAADPRTIIIRGLPALDNDDQPASSSAIDDLLSCLLGASTAKRVVQNSTTFQSLAGATYAKVRCSTDRDALFISRVSTRLRVEATYPTVYISVDKPPSVRKREYELRVARRSEASSD